MQSKIRKVERKNKRQPQLYARSILTSVLRPFSE